MITAFGCILLFIGGIFAIMYSAIYCFMIHGFGGLFMDRVFALFIIICGITGIVLAITHFPHIAINIIWQ